MTTDDNLRQTSSSMSNSSNNSAKSALHILLSPDGYYTYLQIPKPPTTTHKSLLSSSKTASNEGTGSSDDDNTPTIDKTKIEKNYRRLSLKLHPDRPGGDEESFRMLERAKCVLMSDKLRKEYDLLGLDLEEEEHHANDDDVHDGDDGDGEKKDSGGNPDSLMSHMASATVATILQLALRTAMMAFVSLFLTRYKYTTLAVILFVSYTAFQINKARTSGMTGIITLFDTVSPLIIGIGIFLMYYGRYTPPSPLSDEGSSTTDTTDTNDISRGFWTWTFWAGEALVMTMFAMNTVGKENSVLQPSVPLAILFYVLSMIVCLWLRGKTWRYVTVLGMEMGCALIAVLVFPIMEMILEEIMNEKLRKVGEKVRLYSKVMEESYKKKLEEAESSCNDNKVGFKVNLKSKSVELD